uniref:Uncharacterized protein n=1 Tax=Rhizophora mucronata TaxID=61149 RepID=A0A2P2PZ57_RHIMU
MDRRIVLPKPKGS